MKITVLVENTTSNKELQAKHGLSLYIETKNHKILFDVGTNNLFAKNAKKLGIDLSQVDILVISHGHKDHGGALKTFLKINSKAKVYLSKSAFDCHFAKILFMRINVGIDKHLSSQERLVFVEDSMLIDNIELLTVNCNANATLKSNASLLKNINGKIVSDDFDHEIYMLVGEDGKKQLFTGCSHKGIEHILQEVKQVKQINIDNVVGGFHLWNPITKKSENSNFIDNLANALCKGKSIFYTCHCTGVKVYKKMKQIMKEQLHYISTGQEIIL